ncbi:(d)CMP kinase [Chryseobacterium sp. A301]
MNRKPVIAMDGFSSTGKSSISKEIAKKLGLIHLDTGALYRGITYFALSKCRSSKKSLDLEKLYSHFDRIELEFKQNENELDLYLNGQNIAMEIRSPEVSDHVSYIAKQAPVRDFLLSTQRQIAQKGGVIMDGRDIGTTVLPDADYKFFLTASIDERTLRRYLELLSFGQKTSKEEVKQNLEQRDKMDSEREVSPLRKAEDAILIDNTKLTKEQTIALILSHITK